LTGRPVPIVRHTWTISGTISQRQYEGDDVTSIPLTVTVINDDKAFNIIKSDKPENFNQPGEGFNYLIDIDLDPAYI